MTYNESKHNYQEIPFTDNMELNGYFQTEKYFINARQEILEKFGTTKTLINKTSIHIRRGDYLLYPTKHPLPPFEYYTNNINTNKEYIIFSDDIPWCKQAFKNYNNIEYSENKSELEDLELMMRCKNNIIANSSFSWWGAWLNQNENKIVITPKVWFGPDNSHLNSSDLILENWIKK